MSRSICPSARFIQAADRPGPVTADGSDQINWPAGTSTAADSGVPPPQKRRKTGQAKGGRASASAAAGGMRSDGSASSPRSSARTASPQPNDGHPENSNSSTAANRNGISDARNASNMPYSHDELAVIATLAMHTNHDKSLQHSAKLDSDMLDAHEHPLHSQSNVYSHSRLSTAVSASPLSQHRQQLQQHLQRDGRAASSVAQRDYVHVAPVSEEDSLQGLRNSLVRECGEARDTISRLQDFLARSERAIAALDARAGLQSASIVPGPGTEKNVTGESVCDIQSVFSLPCLIHLSMCPSSKRLASKPGLLSSTSAFATRDTEGLFAGCSTEVDSAEAAQRDRPRANDDKRG